MYYGGFGVTLLANPEFFYGADGLVPYFKASPGPVGTFFGRAFGACMTGMAALNFLDGADKATMLKAMAIGGAWIAMGGSHTRRGGAQPDARWRVPCVRRAARTVLRARSRARAWSSP